MTSYLYQVGGRGGADRDNGQAGIVFPTANGWGYATTPVAANRGYTVRGVPSRNMLITAVSFVVTTASGVDDAFDVGIYDATLTRLGSSGPKTSAGPGVTGGGVNTTGTKTAALSAPVQLNARTVYYAAISVAAAGATVGSAGFNTIGNARMFGITAGLVELDAKDAMHPLPASWGAVSAVTSTVVVLGLKE